MGLGKMEKRQNAPTFTSSTETLTNIVGSTIGIYVVEVSTGVDDLPTTTTIKTIGDRRKTSTTSATTATFIAASTPTTTPTSSLLTTTDSNGNTITSSTAAAASPVVTSTPTSSPSKKGGISPGAIAGAAVGCLIGGALIAFLATWLFFRKRNQRVQSSQDRYYGAGGARTDPKSSKGLVAVNEKPTSSSDNVAFGWQAFLPQSADDRTMQNSVKTFFDQIELHVDNYYHKANVQIDGTTREALSEIDSGRLPGPIEELMSNQRTMLSVIKHCLANLLVEKLSPNVNPSASLLPPNLAVASTKLTDGSARSKEHEALQQAHSQWKVLNAYLFPQAQDDPAYLHNRDNIAHDVSQLMAVAFAPWQKPQEDANALHMHEKSLVTSAGNVGTLVQTQPSQYDFRWDTGKERSTSSRSLITLPGFWKSSDEKGRPLEQAQLLVSPFIVRV